MNTAKTFIGVYKRSVHANDAAFRHRLDLERMIIWADLVVIQCINSD